MTSKLGIIGGAGPQATSFFYTRVVEESIKILLYRPEIIIDSIRINIADEHDFLNQITYSSRLYHSAIYKGLMNLKNVGVETVVMPCISLQSAVIVTANQLDLHVITPFENKISLQINNSDRVALLSAKPLLAQIKFILKQLNVPKKKIIFMEEKQQNVIDNIIHQIIQGVSPYVFSEDLNIISKSLSNNGATMMLIACSELSLIPNRQTSYCYIDLLEEMISCSVKWIVNNS